MMKQYRSVGSSCHPPRQYESEPSSSVTLDRQQFVLLLSCRRCGSVPRTLDRSRGEADTCVSCVVGHVHHHQCVVVVQCEQTLYFLLIRTVHCTLVQQTQYGSKDTRFPATWIVDRLNLSWDNSGLDDTEKEPFCAIAGSCP